MLGVQTERYVFFFRHELCLVLHVEVFFPPQLRAKARDRVPLRSEFIQAIVTVREGAGVDRFAAP